MASKTWLRNARLHRAFGLLAVAIAAALILGKVSSNATSRSRRASRIENRATSGSGVAMHAPLPIYFEKNQGQVNPRARFVARTAGNSLFLTDNAAIFALIGGNLIRSKLPDGFGGARQATGKLVQSNVAIRLVGANPHPAILGEAPLRARVNYLIGSNPANWHRDIPTFSRVRYHQVYPGIDLVYYGTPGTLEYDLIAQPAAAVSKIRFAIEGAGRTRLDANGNLTIQTAAGALTMLLPRVYQANPGGSRSLVRASYTISRIRTAHGRTGQPLVGIALGRYDRSRAIVIDPQLVYSTYYGGSAQSRAPLNLEQFSFLMQGQSVVVADGAFDVAIGPNDSAYLTGQTFSTNLPGITASSLQQTLKGANTPPNQNPNSFIAKFDPTKTGASSLVWATYIGGSGDTAAADAGHGNGDLAFGIAVDGNGEPTIVGQTYSTNFPATSSCGAWGQKNNQASTDVNVGFISELNAAGDGIVYSCYIPGSQNATAARVKLQKNCASGCDTFVVGSTQSTPADGFPVTSNAFQSTLKGTNGKSNVFVLEVRSNGTDEHYCSYYGGSGNGTNADAGLGLDINGSEQIAIAGVTYSSDLTLTSNALQTAYKGGTNATSNAFVAEFDPSLSGASSLLYATYLGGTGASANGITVGDGATAIAEHNGAFYLTGFTASTDFFNYTAGPPSGSAPAFQSSNPDNTGSGAPATSAFVAEINPSLAAASQLVYGSYFGGTGFLLAGTTGLGDVATDIGYDSNNTTVYLVGLTTSSNNGTGSWISANACQQANNSSGVPVTAGPFTFFVPVTAFVAGLNITDTTAANQLTFGTYLGGSGELDLASGATGTQVGSGPFLYVSGMTFSADFPVTTTAFQTTNHAAPTPTSTPGFSNGFLTILDPTSTGCGLGGGFPSPTASSTSTATSTSTASATASATGTATATRTATPTATGTATATATGTQTVTPTATPTATAAAALSYGPQTVKFPSEVVLGTQGNTSGPKTVKLINPKNRKQDAPIDIESITSDDPEFKPSDNCVGTLAPGASCPVTITFTPDAAGKRTGHLDVSNNATNGSISVTLTGSGALGVLTIKPKSVSFGGSPLDIPVNKPLTLVNNDPVPMSIGAIASSNAQFTWSGCANSQIGAKSTCPMTLTFTPASKGRQTATLTIDNDGSKNLAVRMVGIGR